MNARIVVTVTAKVYLGSDIDLTGTAALSPSRHPETTQQAALTETFMTSARGTVAANVRFLGERCSRAVGDACRDAVAKHFKS